MKDSSQNTDFVDVKESPDAFYVAMHLPGVSQDELTVNVVGNMITVAGDLKEEQEVEGDNPRWNLQIRQFGGFEHLLTLPVAVEPNDRYDFDQGVLKLHLTKARGLANPGLEEEARAEAAF